MKTSVKVPIPSFLIALILALACIIGVVPKTQAVSPPPDGGYGGDNTAEGSDALFSLTTGVWNSAVGFRSLYKNATGIRNTAVGYQALYNNKGVYNTNGQDNVAVGANALFGNTFGQRNIAIGSYALYDNTTGSNNIAIGDHALWHFAGSGTTAVGDSFLSGPDYVSVGRMPVIDPSHGRTSDGVLTAYLNAQNDVYVGSIADQGAFGPIYTSTVHVQAQNDIYVGISQTQRVHITATDAFYVAPVYGNPIAGSPVSIDSNGQLGVAPSSKRFKTDIKPINSASEAILALKPVTFRYKKELDAKRIPQFGLVAEEVEKVNPDLVSRDEKGNAYTVRYDAVNAMLLNEFLREHKKVEELEGTVATLAATVREQAAQIQKVSAQVEVNKFATGRICRGGPAPRTVANK